MDISIFSLLLSLGCGLVFSALAYLLAQRDKQREADIEKLEDLIKETAKIVLYEKEKTAALVLSERDKLAVAVKVEHDRLEEKVNAFRIKVAEEYTTTSLLEKITAPLLDKLLAIEHLLYTKVDRHEFEDYKKDRGLK